MQERRSPPSEFERGKGGKGMEVGRSIACPFRGPEMRVKHIKFLLTVVTQAPNTKGRLKGEKYQSGKVAAYGGVPVETKVWYHSVPVFRHDLGEVEQTAACEGLSAGPYHVTRREPIRTSGL
jgi:hypothetical protein